MVFSEAEKGEEIMSFRRRARIGFLPTGHHRYWPQFPNLKNRALKMCKRFEEVIKGYADIFSPGLVDTPEKGVAAGNFFQEQDIDLILIFPLVYTPSINVAGAVIDSNLPLRILNAHEDRTRDYTKEDTEDYLQHEGVCCIPEIGGMLARMGKEFHVRTGTLSDKRLHQELQADFMGAFAAKKFRAIRAGLIGEIYTGMTDMPIDEQRLLRTTGNLLIRPEVEEIIDAYQKVTDEELKDMYAQFRQLYEVDRTVTNEHMRFSAQIAVAFDTIIKRHNIDCFGFYWWGEKKLVTQIRAQAGLAVSRLAAQGIAGVTEGDVKSAMAMKILNLLGGFGMFVEFFAMDFAENFVLMGHDGPANVKMAKGKPRLTHLDIIHGKTGHGLGIDFDMDPGPVTLLNLSEHTSPSNDRFKLIYSIGEVIPGSVLNIGNPNCRIRLEHPFPEFFERWCQQGPEHHIALGKGDLSAALESFAEATQLEIVRV